MADINQTNQGAAYDAREKYISAQTIAPTFLPANNADIFDDLNNLLKLAENAQGGKAYEEQKRFEDQQLLQDKTTEIKSSNLLPLIGVAALLYFMSK